MSTTLLSFSVLMPVLWIGYTFRAWWNARQNWNSYPADTKAFFLVVAPPIMFAMDLILVTDRLFYFACSKGVHVLAAVLLIAGSVDQALASQIDHCMSYQPLAQSWLFRLPRSGAI
jgi:hypothetical protein